jgi:uncharacterized protein YdaU (DUF1376 family)
MADFPVMPLWTDAYLSDTKHLTTTEHGAYLLLLMAMWRTKTKSLPHDDKRLAKIAGCTPSQWARMRPTIMEFFDVEDGQITQGRLTDEAIAVRQRSAKQSDKAKSRWLKNKGRNDPAALPLECRGNASLNPSHIPSSTNTQQQLSTTPPEQPPLPDDPTDRETILAAMGHEPSGLTPTGRLVGNPADMEEARRWRDDLGLSLTECVAVIRAVAARPAYKPPARFSYFAAVMAELAAAKAAPVRVAAAGRGSVVPFAPIPEFDFDAFMARHPELKR